jgi:hypothetical protein
LLEDVIMSQAPTTEQIRQAIDSGATGEKLGHPDPAAAPLGTDAEAGGNSPTPSERKLEARSQVSHVETVPPDGRVVYFGLIALVAGAIMLIGSFA